MMTATEIKLPSSYSGWTSSYHQEELQNHCHQTDTAQVMLICGQDLFLQTPSLAL